MALTDHEYIFIQNQDAPDFPSYLRSVWITWPHLNYNEIRKKTSRLWKARKQWLKRLEPTPSRLTNKCESCCSTFHQTWTPEKELPTYTPSNVTLTVFEWENILNESSDECNIKTSCWGCRENELNQLAHIDYGGCLYDTACDIGLLEPCDLNLPPLPASPPSTD